LGWAYGFAKSHDIIFINIFRIFSKYIMVHGNIVISASRNGEMEKDSLMKWMDSHKKNGDKCLSAKKF
jgi:hypothetical protein